MASEDKIDVNIRPAVKSDCEEISRMIKELNIYENLENPALITKTVLEEDGFGEDVFFQCLVAEIPNYMTGCSSLVGYALCYPAYSTLSVGRYIMLESLYVAEEFRRRGIGKLLMKAVAQIAIDRHCHRVSWGVLKWNEETIAFYKRLGAMESNEEDGCLQMELNRTELEKLVPSLSS